MKDDIIQLVDPSAIEQHVFRRGPGIAEAIADVEPKGYAADIRVAGAPEPCIVIGPYTAAPVQRPEISDGIKSVAVTVKCHISRGAHTVDLLIVVEMPGLVPGRRDHHGIHFRLFQYDVAVKGLSLTETIEMTGDTPPALLNGETQLQTLVLIDRFP